MKRQSYLIRLLMILLPVLIFTACSGIKSQSTPADENHYLTPIPQNTLDAFLITPPVTSKMQAVIIARRYLGTTRLEFSEPPGVVFAEEMSQADAIKRAGFPQSSTNDFDGDARAWLVIFEGDFRIIPPDPMHTVTPGPAGQGCAAVIIVASSGVPGGAGTLNCPIPP